MSTKPCNFCENVVPEGRVLSVCDQCISERRTNYNGSKESGTMQFINDYGRRYVVKLHESTYPEHRTEPVVSFHYEGRNMDRVGMFSYYISTLLEVEGGLWIDGSDSTAVVNAETMKEIQAFAIAEAESKFGWVAQQKEEL